MMALTIMSSIWIIALVLFQTWNVSSLTVHKYLDGDVTLVGLFDLSQGANCDKTNRDAEKTLDAIRWYLKRLSSSDLPFRLGLKGYDTCGPAGTVVSTALDVMSRHKYGEDRDDKLIGFISMLSNEDTISLATVLKSMPEEDRFVHISVAATATELGNATSFPNFFRVIPDDRKRVTSLFKAMKFLEWNRIGLIYEDRPEWIPLKNAFDTAAHENRICISKTARIRTNNFGEVDTFGQIDEELDNILKASIEIGGVVFIGSGKVGRHVLERSDGHFNLASLPRFILTGSVGLTTDTFHSVSRDEVLTKTLGSLVIVPAYIEITSYIEYLQSLQTHSDGLGQELHVNYGILAAHSIAKAAKQEFRKQCNGSESKCASKIQPNTLVDRMSHAQLDLHSDFIMSVQPLAFSRYKLNFSRSPDPDFSRHDVYQVYVFTRHGTADQPELHQVGSLSGKSEFNLNLAAFSQYREDGTPDLRKGQCPAGKICNECIEKDIPEHKIHMPGDIYVVGIAPVYNKAEDISGCRDIYPEGFELARALQYGLEVFNTNDTYEEYKSKFGVNTVGLVILNSCTNDLVIVRKILELNKYGIHNADSTKDNNISRKVLGYIGAFTSDVSLRVADTLTEMNHVQISYSSTSAKLNDDKYPYFLRVVPPDNLQVQAILHILKALDAQFVQVLYAEKDYGEAALEILKRDASEHNICIKQSMKVEKESDDNYNHYYDWIQKEPNAKVVILFLHHQFLVPLLKDLNNKMNVGKYHFIASDGWGRHKDMLDHNIALGTITVSIEMNKIDGLVPFVQNLGTSADHHDIWREQYLQKHQNCYYDWSFDKRYPKRCPDKDDTPKIDFPRDDWGNFATLSVLSLLKGSAEFYGKHCPNAPGLCNEFSLRVDDLVRNIKGVSFDTTGQGSKRVFDEYGNGNIGYSIYSVQKNESDGNKLCYVKIGKYEQGALELDVTKLEGHDFRSPCPNKDTCRPENCENYATKAEQCPPHSSEQSFMDWQQVLAFAGGIIGIILAIALLVCVIIRLKITNKSGSDTPGTQYITPAEMTGQVNNAADSYHDILIHEETRY